MGEIKRQYEKYLELKEGTPFGYNRFWNLLLDYSFDEILVMKHKKDLTNKTNNRKGYRKYKDSFIKQVKSLKDFGYRAIDIAFELKITINQVNYIISLNKA